MNKTALIIDDEGFDRVIIAALIRQSGYEVLAEASSGTEGVKLALELSPDIIILDKRMPDIDGFEVFDQLISNNCPSCIILLSGDDLSGQRDQLIARGMKDVFKKPIKREVLKEALDKLFVSKD